MVGQLVLRSPSVWCNTNTKWQLKACQLEWFTKGKLEVLQRDQSDSSSLPCLQKRKRRERKRRERKRKGSGFKPRRPLSNLLSSQSQMPPNTDLLIRLSDFLTPYQPTRALRSSDAGIFTVPKRLWSSRQAALEMQALLTFKNQPKTYLFRQDLPIRMQENSNRSHRQRLRAGKSERQADNAARPTRAYGCRTVHPERFSRRPHTSPSTHGAISHHWRLRTMRAAQGHTR
ncbi:hypothetical protein N1851_023190 [Merluccius polli]|uniref:Uncharacterized protein n=1 Tax=Merluccius polli TaxID=89951 RepID=A0AA47MH00_MERPO|nr:hypothetical protein N1851_023190 [Merluccius polli]